MASNISSVAKLVDGGGSCIKEFGRLKKKVEKAMEKRKRAINVDGDIDQSQNQPSLNSSTYPVTPLHLDATSRIHFFEAPPPYSETIDEQPEIPETRYARTPPYTEVADERTPGQQVGVYIDQTNRSMSVGSYDQTNRSMSVGSYDMTFQLPRYTPNLSVRGNHDRRGSDSSAVIMFNGVVTNLPPILTRSKEDARILNNPDIDALMRQMNDDYEDPVAFIVNKNLVVRAKVVDMNCCVEKRCWCFVSDGMGASNQEEVVIIIKCDSFDIDETQLLRKVLQQINFIFEKGKCGHTLSEYDVIEFHSDIMCMPKNIGMLFYRSTLQCLKKLFLPSATYLFGMYIEQSELPWAKHLPLRLLLRLGAEFKYYPCPLFNILNRSPVYCSIDRTILKSYIDFNSFISTIPRVPGVTINRNGEDTIIRLPKQRFDEVLNAMNAAEDNIISLAGNFTPTCDGHLVTVESIDRYKTQTLSLKCKENRKVVCASFFVMSGTLTSAQNNIQAKATIVEDGVVAEVTTDVMKKFKNGIREKRNCAITAGCLPEGTYKISVEWCSTDPTEKRLRKKSPIDAIPLDNCTTMKIRHGYDYTSNNLTEKMHLVEVHFLPQENGKYVSKTSAQELGKIVTGQIADACMSALSSHLVTLMSYKMTRIGLRINLASEIEYKIGSNHSTLPPDVLMTLDEKLIPAIHNVISRSDERVAVELIFHVRKIV